MITPTIINMKKLLFSLSLVLSSLALTACDICGCGIGSYYTGILPEFNKHIIGVRYRYNALTTHLGPGGVSSYLTTREYFHTVDVWGGWTVGKKFRIMGYVPLSYNEKSNRGTHSSRKGVGDASIQAYYNVLSTRGSAGSNLVLQSLWIGGGLKLPTGDYDPAFKDNSGQSANTFQLGTGSVDYTLNLMYDLRIQDFGINTTVNYKLNSENSDRYRSGNKMSATLQAYYKVRVKNKITVAPNAGLAYETAQLDRDDHITVDASGGNILMQGTGVEVTNGKIALGGSFQVPLHQHLARGLVKADNRLMVHLSFML